MTTDSLMWIGPTSGTSNGLSQRIRVCSCSCSSSPIVSTTFSASFFRREKQWFFRGIPQDSLLFPILLKNENQQRVYCCFLYYRTIFEKSQSTFMTISTSFFSCFVAHFTKEQHFPE